MHLTNQHGSTFLAVLGAECMKLRRAPIWLALVLLPLLAATMGSYNYAQNIELLTDGWASLWTQHSLFQCCFFLPALMGLLASYQQRLEHLGTNWNLVMTAPVPTASLLISKLLVLEGLGGLTLLLMSGFYILGGRLSGLCGLPDAELISYVLYGLVAFLPIISLQLALSLRIRSFSIPVGLALIGGIFGLEMVNWDLGLFCPYALLMLGMNANGSMALETGERLWFFVSAAVFTAVPLMASLWYCRMKDVHTR